MRNDFDFGLISSLIDGGNISKALLLCDNELERDINSIDAYLLKCRAYLEAGILDKSLMYASLGLERSMIPEKNRLLYEELIEIYAAKKKYSLALHYCHKALSYEPQDIDLLFTRATLLYKNYMFTEALKTLSYLRKLDYKCLYKHDTDVLYYSIKSFL